MGINVLVHHSPGRDDLSGCHVSFDGVSIRPSEAVKWIGVWIDSKLTGEVHIKSRAASAARALNASLALTHAVWGLKPLMARDLARAVVFPRADYGVNCFFPLPPAALKPLKCVNKSIARCITGGYRTASLAALEKEAAILPAPLRLKCSLLHRLAQYLALPPMHGIVPLLHDAICHSPKQAHRASALHFVERLSVVRWPVDVPPRGERIRDRKSRPPKDVTAEQRAGQAEQRPYRDGAVYISTHLGAGQGRRDDLEALAYVLLYLLRGHLPWQGLTAATKEKKYGLIYKRKLATSTESLCYGFPTEFGTFLDYINLYHLPSLDSFFISNSSNDLGIAF
ncbi:hypothetical protein B0H13DRAFT_2367486 [Mycena leptocephala]|nr:hypothetical protein B0H13DRAFT_2367486 [Mycena leptocephala]